MEEVGSRDLPSPELSDRLDNGLARDRTFLATLREDETHGPDEGER